MRGGNKQLFLEVVLLKNFGNPVIDIFALFFVNHAITEGAGASFLHPIESCEACVFRLAPFLLCHPAKGLHVPPYHQDPAALCVAGGPARITREGCGCPRLIIMREIIEHTGAIYV